VPYRASLSGAFGSGVQAPTPRQPLVDVGSIVDAISGGLNAQTQRMTLRHSIAQQDAAQQLADRRQAALEAHQQEMERRQADVERHRAEKDATTEKLNLLKAQAEYGYVPEQQVDMGGFAGLPGMDAMAGAGTVTAPGHIDPTQSLPYRLTEAREAGATQRTQATVAGGLTRTRAALAAHAAATGAKEDPVEKQHRGFLLTRTAQLMKPGEPEGLMKKRTPGLPLATAQQRAEEEWQAAHATASGAHAAPAAGGAPSLSPDQDSAVNEVVARIKAGHGTFEQFAKHPVPPEVLAAVRARLGQH
jgi:hypothetical protein